MPNVAPGPCYATMGWKNYEQRSIPFLVNLVMPCYKYAFLLHILKYISPEWDVIDVLIADEFWPILIQ